MLAFERRMALAELLKANPVMTVEELVRRFGVSAQTMRRDFQYLADQGLLAEVDPSTLAATPTRFNSPDGRWVGVSARVSVLIYNPSLIARRDLPTSVLQLADPRYRGLVAFSPAETDFQPIVTSVERTYGHAAALRWL